MRNISGYLINIIDSYLENRTLLYDTEEGIKHYKITSGVPQGSILGPFLWNLMYDGLLNIILPKGAKIVGYADDIALIVDQPSTELVEITANDSLSRISRWLVSKKLSLAPHKTEAILITRRRNFNLPKLLVDGYDIKIENSLKYLGVILDNRLSFTQHVKTVSEKAVRTANKLVRIMPNINGPNQLTRRLIASVAYAQVTYAAPILSDVIARSKNLRGHLEKVHRLCALRIASAYRTTSTAALAILAGVPPITLTLDERRYIYEKRKLLPIGYTKRDVSQIKRQARDILFAQWQSIWNNCEKGRWTFKIIPQLERWINRKHGELNFYLTQVPSSHGNCEICHESEDNVEHTLFWCKRWENERSVYNISTQWSVEDLVKNMLESKERWSQCSMFIEKVLTEKVKYLNRYESNP